MMPPPKHLVKKRDESITLRFRIEEVPFRPYHETPRKIPSWIVCKTKSGDSILATQWWCQGSIHVHSKNLVSMWPTK